MKLLPRTSSSLFAENKENEHKCHSRRKCRRILRLSEKLRCRVKTHKAMQTNQGVPYQYLLIYYTVCAIPPSPDKLTGCLQAPFYYICWTIQFASRSIFFFPKQIAVSLPHTHAHTHKQTKTTFHLTNAALCSHLLSSEMAGITPRWLRKSALWEFQPLEIRNK